MGLYLFFFYFILATSITLIKRSSNGGKTVIATALAIAHIKSIGGDIQYVYDQYKLLQNHRNRLFHRFIKRGFVDGRPAYIFVTEIKNGNFDDSFSGISTVIAGYAYLDRGAIVPKKKSKRNNVEIKDCYIYEYLPSTDPNVAYGKYRGD